MITGTTGASAPFVCSAARDVPTQRFSSTSQRQVGRESRTDARLALLRQLTPRQIRPAYVARQGPVVWGAIWTAVYLAGCTASTSIPTARRVARPAACTPL